MKAASTVNDVKGVWVWSDPAKRQSTLDQIRKTHLDRILAVLAKSGAAGLSNAEIDSALNVWSMWAVNWQLRELLALNLIVFRVHPFGEAGKYAITPLGVDVLREIG